jgi:hypothetical protein
MLKILKPGKSTFGFLPKMQIYLQTIPKIDRPGSQHSFWKAKSNSDTLESGINIALRLLIFRLFFQGLRPYSGLHRDYLNSTSIRYKWGYTYSFRHFFQGLCLFKGLRLFQTLEYNFFMI